MSTSLTSTERVRAYRQRQRALQGETKYKQEQAKIKRDQRQTTRKLKLEQLNIQEQKALDKMMDMFRDIALETFSSKREGLTIQEIKQEVKQKLIGINNFSNCEELINGIAAVSKDRAKRSTIEQNINKIDLLYRRMFDKPFDCTSQSMEFLNDTTRVLTFIQEHKRWKSAETKAGMINAVTSILRRLPEHQISYEIYSKVNTETRKQLDEIREENLLSPEQQELLLPWGEILGKLASIKEDKNNDGWMFERAIYAMFTLLPPRRSGSILDCSLSQDMEATGGNLLIVDKKMKPTHIILNRYKTHKKYGRYQSVLPPRLSTILKAYIADEDMELGDIVFPKRNSKAYSGSAFSTIVSNIFLKYSGKRLGTTLLRISFASDVFSVQRSVAALKKIALALGHSVSQMSLYNKFGINDLKKVTKDLY